MLASPHLHLWQPPLTSQRLRAEDLGLRGEIAIWSPIPTVICTRATGRISDAMATAIITEGDRRLADGHVPLSFLHHWLGVTGYDLPVRPRFTAWGLKHRAQCGKFHFLVRDGFVRLAVSVSSVVVSGVVSHAEEATLAEALAALVKA